MEIQEKHIKEMLEDDSIRRKYSRLYTDESEGKPFRESCEKTATLWENRRRNTALNKHEHITLHKITAIYF